MPLFYSIALIRDPSPRRRPAPDRDPDRRSRDLGTAAPVRPGAMTRSRPADRARPRSPARRPNPRRRPARPPPGLHARRPRVTDRRPDGSSLQDLNLFTLSNIPGGPPAPRRPPPPDAAGRRPRSSSPSFANPARR